MSEMSPEFSQSPPPYKGLNELLKVDADRVLAAVEYEASSVPPTYRFQDPKVDGSAIYSFMYELATSVNGKALDESELRVARQTFHYAHFIGRRLLGDGMQVSAASFISQYRGLVQFRVKLVEMSDEYISRNGELSGLLAKTRRLIHPIVDDEQHAGLIDRVAALTWRHIDERQLHFSREAIIAAETQALKDEDIFRGVLATWRRDFGDDTSVD